MILFSAASLVPPAVAFVLALGLTPVVRVLARRWGFVAKPKIDRWHKKPTAMMGASQSGWRWLGPGWFWFLILSKVGWLLARLRFFSLWD